MLTEVATIVADARTFLQLVPETYLLAKLRYGFLPQRTASLDITWVQLSPMGRAAFLLDYVARLYQRLPGDAAAALELGEKPTLVFRTTDHPQAAGLAPSAGVPAYSLFFDTDTGARIEVHMGHEGYLALALVMAGATVPGERRRAATVRTS